MMNELEKLLNKEIADNKSFLSAVFSGINRSGLEDEWNKITIRPVLIKNSLFYQFNYYSNVKGITKNFSKDDIKQELEAVAQLGFKSIYLREETCGTQINITKKDKLLIRKIQGLSKVKASLDHDVQKNRIIKSSPQNSYLRVLELSDVNGNIKPSMQGKFKQINEFVKILSDIQDWNEWKQPINIVDCGAGNAYLTFATFHYFKNILNKDVTVMGIDIDPTSIENNKKRAFDLGWDDIDFEVSNIIGFTPISSITPTITMALHACDTATDEAIMKGVSWNSKFILSVPCCHHNLQERLRNTESHEGLKGMFKHGILRERVGDVLTDSFRSLILEIMGYQADVIQYVSTDHTAKNVLIRARKISNTPLANSVENYLSLKKLWNVTPILEELLSQTTDFRERLVLQRIEA